MPRTPQGHLPFEYQLSDKDDDVTSFGGLPIVLDMFRGLRIDEAIRKYVRVAHRPRRHDEVSVIESTVLTMAAGGDCMDDFSRFVADKALQRMLGREFPSPDTVRRLLYEFHDESLIEAARKALPAGEVAYIPEENAALQGLGKVLGYSARALAAQGSCTTATLDVDATIQCSEKREAKFHYEGERGYQPTLGVWVEQDVIVATEFRDGNVPAAKGLLGFIKKAFAELPDTVTHRRLRSDSAAHQTEILLWLLEQAIEFTISAKMTAPLVEACTAYQDWKLLEERKNDDVYIGETFYFLSDWPLGVKQPRVLVLKLVPKQGKLFDEGYGPKYLAVFTNREGTPEELVRWHWGKAGTIEHVHHVLKNELGAGTLPCGRFGANAAWLRLAALTYNVLSALKAIVLPPDLQDARPKKLRFQVFTLPAVVSFHARRLWARLQNGVLRAKELVAGRPKVLGLRPALI